MTKAEVNACLQATGAAKYATTKLSGRTQFVLCFHWSADDVNVVVRTIAGNDVYRTPRQLTALTPEPTYEAHSRSALAGQHGPRH